MLNKINKRLYSWQGYDQYSQLQQGDMAESSIQAVRQQLIHNGIIPLKIKTGITLCRRHWSTTSLMLITRQLATMLEAGLPLLSCLQLVATAHHQAAWRYLLQEILQRVAQGYPLSQALQHYPQVFPALYRQLIATGELTGQLERCFLQLALVQEKQIQLQQKVRNALRYPLFILLVAVLVTLIMLLVVLPEFSQIYQNFQAQLPALTQSLIDISFFLQQYGLVLLTPLILLVYGYSQKLRMKTVWQHREQKILLKLPLLKNLIHTNTLTHIFATLTLTQQSGLSLLAGLSAAEKAAGNIVYQRGIAQISLLLQQGQSFGTALQQVPIFPALCYQLITIGEESGTLDAMLEKLAQIYTQETEQAVERLSQEIEPMLMLILGIIVGGLVIAMYLPIFQLGNVIS